MDPQQASSIKAALLLSRALCADIEDDPFSLHENGVIYDELTGLLVYEGYILSSIDVARGALVLLRSLIDDLSKATAQEPQELGRIFELSVALQDAMFEAETQVDENP